MMMQGGAFSGRSSGRPEPDGETFGRIYDRRVIARILPYVRP